MISFYNELPIVLLLFIIYYFTWKVKMEYEINWMIRYLSKTENKASNIESAGNWIGVNINNQKQNGLKDVWVDSYILDFFNTNK